MIDRVASSALLIGAVSALCGCIAQSDAMAASPDASAEAGLAQIPPTPAVQPPVEALAELSFTYDGELTQGGWIRGIAPDGTVLVRLNETNLKLSPGGKFFAAFDRDAGEEAILSAKLEDGGTVEVPLAISPRAWNIERVNVAKRSGGSSEAWWKQREPEWNAIVVAREKETAAQGWQQDFIWPVKGRISGRFGSQRIYRGEPGSYHSGLDIAPGAGTPFVAPADGVVVLAVIGFSLEGNLLIIDHGMGLNSAFLHAQSLSVSEGEAVTQGQVLGRVGSSGRATGPHLHWGIKWRDTRLDPLLFVPDAD